MSAEAEFADMMPDRLNVVPFTGFNLHGEPLYDATKAYDVPCRVSGKSLALRRTNTEEMSPIFDIWADVGDHVLNHDDKFSISGDDPRWRTGHLVIFAIGHYTDDQGIHHAKIQCGWMYHRQGQ